MAGGRRLQAALNLVPPSCGEKARLTRKDQASKVATRGTYNS